MFADLDKHPRFILLTSPYKTRSNRKESMTSRQTIPLMNVTSCIDRYGKNGFINRLNHKKQKRPTSRPGALSFNKTNNRYCIKKKHKLSYICNCTLEPNLMQSFEGTILLHCMRTHYAE